MQIDNSNLRPTERIPLWRNVQVRSWILQIFLILIVFSIGYYFYSNFINRTASSPVNLGFDFLDDRAGFDITGSNFDNNSTLKNAYITGLLNTIRLVIPGLILTTIVGTLVGIARLSKNYIIKTVASGYVEAVRNIPLLVFVVIVYSAFVKETFPRFNSAEDEKVLTAWQLFGDNVIISRRGLDVPWFVGSRLTLFLIFLTAAGLWWSISKWRAKVQEKTGAASRSGLWGGAAFVAVIVIGWVIFGYGITTPEVIPDKTSGAVVKATGGINMPDGYFAMLMALVIYTSSHIAEIIRGSIQAVNKGQGEAASALALSGFQRMWHVVLPQALRTAIPPLGNQYLNLMKNSSLAGVVAYFDLTAVARTATGGTAPAIPAYLVILVIYLIFSLVISSGVNIFNRRTALVTR